MFNENINIYINFEMYLFHVFDQQKKKKNTTKICFFFSGQLKIATLGETVLSVVSIWWCIYATDIGRFRIFFAKW